MLRWLQVLPLLAVLLTSAGQAYAQPRQLLRIAIRTKITLADTTMRNDAEPAERDASALSAALTEALHAHGARVVDLQAASAAQQLRRESTAQESPTAQTANLSQIDGRLSAHLACTTGSRLPHRKAGNLIGLLNVHCTVHAKLVRVDSGAVVFDKRGRALSALHRGPWRAVERLVQHELPPVLSGLAEQALGALGGAANRWALDLHVSGLATRGQGHSFQRRLTQLPGISNVRKVLQRNHTVQFLLLGEGAKHLAQLGDSIESDSELAATITFESPTVVSALHELSHTFPRPVVSLGVFDPALSREQADAIATSQLSRFRYLQELERELVRGRAAGTALGRARERAEALETAWLLRFSVSRHGDGWLGSCALETSATRKQYAGATASAENADEALRTAFSRFDAKYKKAWQDRNLREVLWPDASPQQMALVVDDFQLIPGSSHERMRFALRNAAALPADGIEARVLMGGRVVGLWTQDSLKPGQRVEQEIALSGLPRDSETGVALQVSYNTNGLRQSAVLTGEAGATRLPDLGLAKEAAPAGYRNLVRTAELQYSSGDWRGALRTLGTAHLHYPTGRGARMLGWIELAEGVAPHSQARRHLEEALLEQRGALNATERRHVGELLSALAEAEALRARLASH